MQLEAASLRLKAVVESDPGALVRILQFFQTRNVVPRHVIARRLGAEYLETEITVDSGELDCSAFRLLIAKIEQLPNVLAVVACEEPPPAGS